MNTIQEAYINALLADASYVKYEGVVDSNAMKTRMTEAQAAFRKGARLELSPCHGAARS